MPQDPEEERHRLDRPRDDVSYGAGGIGAGATPRPVEPSPIPADMALPPPRIAVGDRHDAYLEADPNQLVRARFTHKPGATPPQDLQNAQQFHRGEPVEDVTVMDDEASVWDARPRP
jgi:hypothetical protein